MNKLDSFFRLSERGTTVATELRAGLVTFLTMAYTLFVVPQILSSAGMPPEDVTIALGVASAIACLVMGLYANFPFGLAPGLGLTAYFAFGVVQGMGVSWQTALAAVFIEGIIFILFSFGGVRTAIINAIPRPVKLATAPGIGLFLALIGLQTSGIVVSDADTLVTLGNLQQPRATLSLLGLIIIGVLLSLELRGAILIGILSTTAVAWGTGLKPLPEGIYSLPHLPRQTFLALDLGQIFSFSILTVVFAFLFVDIFDTAGTLLGVGKAAGFLNEAGELPGSSKAFTADAVGTTTGALLGTSTVTTYVESAAGVEEGGRTGLTALVVGFLYLLSLFFIPIIVSIPRAATAPALIIVGALMISGAGDIDWNNKERAVPAFLTLSLMPFTFSIANGISFGICSYVLIKVLTGKWREVNPLLYCLAILLFIYFVTLKQ